MATEQDITGICKLLSAEARVRIIRLLRDHALCVGALSSRLDITQGAVSQHLRILRDAGLLVSDKRGSYVHYRLNEKSLGKWQARIAEFLKTPAHAEKRPRAARAGCGRKARR